MTKKTVALLLAILMGPTLAYSADGCIMTETDNINMTVVSDGELTFDEVYQILEIVASSMDGVAIPRKALCENATDSMEVTVSMNTESDIGA